MFLMFWALYNLVLSKEGTYVGTLTQLNHRKKMERVGEEGAMGKNPRTQKGRILGPKK